ncbi:MAG: hypothetical protein FJX77_10345, partial [Armatimonadetes bacterium]|nr:hypothetical protein [Armatimonadota bacterium]
MPEIPAFSRIFSLRPAERQRFLGREFQPLADADVSRPSGLEQLHWAAGRHAAVFRCRMAHGGEVAVRCPLRRVEPEPGRRAGRVSEHLESLAPPLPHFVPSRYVGEALYIERAWQPAFLLEWVAGRTLTDWVHNRAKESDSRALLE